MKAEKLAEAIRLAKKAGHVLIATADERGMPHITAAGLTLRQTSWQRSCHLRY